MSQIAVVKDSMLVPVRGELPPTMAPDTRDQVMMLAASIRSSYIQAARAIAGLSLELFAMKDLFSDERAFMRYGIEAFGWSKPRAKRYFLIAEVVRAHWVDSRGYMNPLIGNMAAGIFTTLDGDTPREVIEQLNEAESKKSDRCR